MLTAVNPGWSKSSPARAGQCKTVHLKGTRKWTLHSPPPTIHPVFSPTVIIPPVSFISLSHLICMFTRWSDFSLHLGRLAVQGCPSACKIKGWKEGWDWHTHTFSSPLSVSPQLNKNKHCCRMFCGGCYYSLEAACREYWTYANDGWLLCWDLFDHLNRLLSLVPRGLCSLQRQSVRLQPTCPWYSYSGGPTSADNPTGKMRTNLTNLFSDCVGATNSTWFST